MKKHIVIICIFVFSMCLTISANADLTISYSAGAYDKTSLGAQWPATTYDELHLVGLSGNTSLAYGMPQTVNLQSLTFVTGLNSDTGHTDNYTADWLFTVNGVTSTITQSYQVIIGSVDTLKLLPSTTYITLVSGEKLKIDLLGQEFTPTSTAYGYNQANVSYTQTPIPAAFWLLGSGLFGLACVRRRREI